jgi:hypothetical protein
MFTTAVRNGHSVGASCPRALLLQRPPVTAASYFCNGRLLSRLIFVTAAASAAALTL